MAHALSSQRYPTKSLLADTERNGSSDPRFRQKRRNRHANWSDILRTSTALRGEKAGGKQSAFAGDGVWLDYRRRMQKHEK